MSRTALSGATQTSRATGAAREFEEIPLSPEERVWVTGDVHLDPTRGDRVDAFLRFLEHARDRVDRLCILGDLFDYWIGVEHARRSAYAPVVAALADAAASGYPVDFVCGNRDFLGPDELAAIGLRVWGDGLVYCREGRRTVVTHGDLLVEGDASYKRYRRLVRSPPVRSLYGAVPVAMRLAIAAWIRRISRRKLGRIEAYAFPIDLPLAAVWLESVDARDLLMGHLHREERHELGERTVAMLPGWSPDGAPYFVVGPGAELRRFR